MGKRHKSKFPSHRNKVCRTLWRDVLWKLISFFYPYFILWLSAEASAGNQEGCLSLTTDKDHNDVFCINSALIRCHIIAIAHYFSCSFKHFLFLIFFVLVSVNVMLLLLSYVQSTQEKLSLDLPVYIKVKLMNKAWSQLVWIEDSSVCARWAQEKKQKPEKHFQHVAPRLYVQGEGQLSDIFAIFSMSLSSCPQTRQQRKNWKCFVQLNAACPWKS